MVQITLDVSELVAKALDPKLCMEFYGETPGEVVESALQDAMKLWADSSLEEEIESQVKFMEGKE